jgi:serine/threonine protein kinase
MPIAMDEVVHSLKNRLRVCEFDEAAASPLSHLIDDITAEKLNAPLFWYHLLRTCFGDQDRNKIMLALRNDAERERVKNFLKTVVPQKTREIALSLLSLHLNDTHVATVNPDEWGINPDTFTETYYYDDANNELRSFIESSDVLIRVYYSLDHTLGAGSEATLHIALLGIARRITENQTVPLKKQYVPLVDHNGRLIVSRHIMVAKMPHIPPENGSEKAKVDVRRHQRGSINLRDMTLPHFYTQESKKTLPGLWSLPRFADFGEDKCLYYDYVEGVPLHTLLDAKEFDILARLITLKHMAQTLHYIHSMGYIHNDIKPQNVVISNQGIATIIDFGLTEKYLDAYKTLNDSMQKKIVGTPMFMSPEQVTKKSKADPALSQIRYAAPIKSQDDLAFLRRQHAKSIVVIDGLEFKEVDIKSPEYKTPFFFDSYLKANFFSDEKGAVVPITGKSDVFSLGVNILYLLTGLSHLSNPKNTKSIIQDLSGYTIRLPNIKDTLPDPLNITESSTEESYKEKLESLILATLEYSPQRRPPAHEAAQRLRDIIWLYFGGDRSFFSTFDDECTYLRNRLYRKR